jgi:hypothetical protein
MENIVINAKMFNGYLVKYPMGSHLDFYATTYRALKDGLKTITWSYKPDIYIIDGWMKTPKFRKLTKLQKDTIYKEI